MVSTMKRRNIGALITGLLLLIIGVGFIGEATHLWNFNLFFPGWWTLFIIIPAFSATVGQGFHTGNVAWLIFGVLMLLACQDWFKSFMSWQLFLGIFIVYWGLVIVIKFAMGPKQKQIRQEYPSISGQYNSTGAVSAAPQEGYCAAGDPDSNPSYTAILSGNTVKNCSRNLESVHVEAIMGGVDLDLSDAVVTHDIQVTATAILGGIDIIVPRNVKVVMRSVPILGGCDNTAASLPVDADAPTVYFDCTAVLGGVDLK